VFKWIFADFCSETSGISEAKSKVSINLYPNPFENQLIIQCASKAEHTFILYDNLSRIELKETFFGNSIIYTDNLAKGIYFYEIRNTEKQLKTGKVIKN